MSGIITLRAPVVAVAAGSDLTSPIAACPVKGTVFGVRYIPTSVLTGVDTNTRTLTLFNRGQAGSGTTSIATKTFSNGKNIAANASGPITLTSTAADKVVNQGDVLDWESLHVAGGLADPGGMVEVDILPALS